MAGKTGKIIGAAGAAGAVAAAVGVAVSRRRAAEPVTFYVRPGTDGWIVSKDGGSGPVSTHTTKKDAITAGRKLASDKAPSTLVLHYADGKVQKRLSYDGSN